MNDREYVVEMVAINNVPMATSRPLPIRFSAVCAYAQQYDYTGQEFDLLLRLVRALDDEYLKIKAEQRDHG